jgi:hypothetical protein
VQHGRAAAPGFHAKEVANDVALNQQWQQLLLLVVVLPMCNKGLH